MRERQLGSGFSVTRKLFSHGSFGRSCVFSLEKWILICVVDLGKREGWGAHSSQALRIRVNIHTN